MSKQNNLKILKFALGEYSDKGKEALFKCPNCNHRKRKLSISTEKWAYKCWTCNFHGRNLKRMLEEIGYEHLAPQLITQSEDELTEQDRAIDLLKRHLGMYSVEQTVLKLPEEFKNLVDYYNKDAMEYLTNRGITEQDIIDYRIGYCDNGLYSGRVIFPSFDESGELNMYVGRTYSGSYMRYMNPIVKYNQFIFNEFDVDWSNRIVVVEGIYDAIACGRNSIPLCGSLLSTRSKLFKKLVSATGDVIVCLDIDAEDKQQEIVDNLLEYRDNVFVVDLKAGDDPADAGRKKMMRILDKCKPAKSSIDKVITVARGFA